MTHICITGKESKQEKVVERLSNVLGYDSQTLCEIRTDYLSLSCEKSLSFLRSLPEAFSRRVVLSRRRKTFHSPSAGACTWGEEVFSSWWENACSMQAWFAIDLDYEPRKINNLMRRKKVLQNTKLFFSFHHSIEHIREILPKLKADAEKYGAGIKIAAPVKNFSEMKELKELKDSIPEKTLSIVIAMGDFGKLWRWSALNGFLSYFAYTKDNITAPGQFSWSAIKPYLPCKKLPDLYVLLQEDSNNFFGEKNWNRCFQAQNRNAYYLSFSFSKENIQKSLEEEILPWMSKIQVKGASVTRPYKESFLLNSKNRPINTIYKNSNKRWAFANTDAIAVEKLLKKHGAKKKILLLGTGGVAKGVGNYLKEKNFSPQYWTRENGFLKNCPLNEVSAIISTWPFFSQKTLVEQLMQVKSIEELQKIPLWIDLQFQYEEKDSPLKKLCELLNTRYIHGSHCWHLQAREQFYLWFPKEKRNTKKMIREILSHIPRSKSETIRALFLSAINKKLNFIHHPSLCEDSIYFLESLKKIGLEVKEENDTWIVKKEKNWNINSQTLFLGESATALRFMAALSTLLPTGTLYLKGTKSLLNRPMEEIFELLKLHWDKNWPLKITSSQPLPEKISIQKSSQYASGFLMAWSGYLKKEEKKTLELVGERHSFSYIELSLQMLKELGFSYSIEKKSKERTLVQLIYDKKNSASFLEENKKDWHIQLDFSAIPFCEVLLKYLSLASIYDHISIKKKQQGDSIFPQLLEKQKGKSFIELSLSQTPDLAPPLWTYTILKRKALHIHSTPQLRFKESNRAKSLVEAAKSLGFMAKEYDDGFKIIPLEDYMPSQSILLSSKGDHRLAMAYGILQFKYSQIEIDDKECVNKSFPQFWKLLKYVRACLP